MDSKIFEKPVFDRRRGIYEGTGQWCGREVFITLDVGREDEAEAGLRLLEQFFAKAEDWDKKMREAAAEDLTDLANEWKDDNAGQADMPDITEEDFAARIGIMSVHVDVKGNFDMYYDDDDMFWGHAVCVYGNIESGIFHADMEG